MVAYKPLTEADHIVLMETKSPTDPELFAAIKATSTRPPLEVLCDPTPEEEQAVRQCLQVWADGYVIPHGPYMWGFTRWTI